MHRSIRATTTSRIVRALAVTIAAAALLPLAQVSAATKRTTAKKPTPTTTAPTTAAPTTNPQRPKATLRIGAIPDQDPARLTRLYSQVAVYLSKKLDVKAEYVPVTDYAAAVNLFRTGDLDLVWFGGLTGVQARLQTPGTKVLAQRDIDEAFRSVFIANVSANVPPVATAKNLAFLKGLRFTYGSNASTSGFVMPEYFLDQAGLDDDKDFNGPVGFSGSHDKTIDLVQAGTYEAGALNEQVWKARKAAGTVDLTKVVEVYRTPGYHDYQWNAGPNTEARFGTGFTEKLKAALLGLDSSTPESQAILDLFGAKKFVPADPNDYKDIERIGRKLRLIN